MMLRAIPPRTSTGRSIRSMDSMRFRTGGIRLNIGVGSLGQATQRETPTSFKPRIQAPKRKPIGEKVDIEKIKTWVIKELAAIMELEGLTKKNSMEKKKQFLLGFIPEYMTEEIMKVAEKLSKELQG